jgi:hypothetical protein
MLFKDSVVLTGVPRPWHGIAEQCAPLAYSGSKWPHTKTPLMQRAATTTPRARARPDRPRKSKQEQTGRAHTTKKTNSDHFCLCPMPPTSYMREPAIDPRTAYPPIPLSTK